MGLSPREKEGCRKMLGYLGSSDLISLYETVAKGVTAIRDRAELIEGIIARSRSAEELLNRKKSYKEFILRYLSSEGIFMYTSNTKPELIQKVLKYWAETESSTAIQSNVTVQSSPPASRPQQGTLDIDVGQISFLINNMSLNPQTVPQCQSRTQATRPKQKALPPKSKSAAVTFTVSLSAKVSRNIAEPSQAPSGKGRRKK